jgi:hypothetical protein
VLQILSSWLLLWSGQKRVQQSMVLFVWIID